MFESLKQRIASYALKKTLGDFGKEVMAADTELYQGYQLERYNPDMLVQRKGGLRIYDKMRKDDTIRACLGLKKYAVLSSGWEIAPASDKNKDKEPAKFIEDCFNLLEGSFDDCLLEIMTAFDYGFSCTEKVVDVASKGKHSGKVILQKLKTRKPHGIDFRVDIHGNLEPQGVMQNRTNTFRTDKFIIFVNNPEFNNWYGESDLRSCYRAWWSKDNIIKFWNMFLERYGMPPAVGKITKPLLDESADREKLEKILRRLQAAASIILPDGIDLSFPGVTGRAALSYKEAVEKHDMAIARALLVPSLLGLTVQGDTGSYSQSKTHFNIFLWIILKLRRTIEELIFEHLIRELVDYNFSVEEYPRFRFKQLDEAQKLELARLWIEAISKGAANSSLGDENTLRSILGWPEKKEEDKPPEENKPPEEEPEEDEPEDEPEEEEPEEEKEESFAASRQLTKYERRVNFSKIDKDLDDLEIEARVELIKILADQRDALKGVLTKKFEAGAINGKFIRDLQLKYLRPLQQTVREMLREAYMSGQTDLASEVKKPKAMQKLPPTYAIQWLTERSFFIKGVLEDTVKNGVKGVLMGALESGEPIKETMLKIDRIYRPLIGTGVISDTGQTEPYRINTLIRTNLTSAYNKGRVAMSEDPDLKDYVIAFQFSAVLDVNTTEQCQELDSEIIMKNDPDFQRFVPPLHFECRSLLVPVTKDDMPFTSISRSKSDAVLALTPEEFGGRVGKATDRGAVILAQAKQVRKAAGLEAMSTERVKGMIDKCF